MNFWQEWKEWLGVTTELPDSTLHILFGMALLLVASAIVKRTPWNVLPWLILLGLELVNETYDMLNPASGEQRLSASLHDLWLTMICPTVLLLVVPMLIRRAAQAKADRPSADGFEQPLE